jgi:hypothetical protein
MRQGELFEKRPPGFHDPQFDGATYDKPRDQVRLGEQMQRVYDVLKTGKWVTLWEIALVTSDPIQSISARIRDLRKPRFGAHNVQGRNIGGGTWEYRLVAHGTEEGVEK